MPDKSLFGEYLLLCRLGEGRTGRVFKAKHRNSGQIVAMKMLSSEAASSQLQVERFRRKSKILTSLKHPNLVAAIGASESKGRHCLIMEYVDGEDLGTIVKRDGPLPVVKAVDYITQASQGLGYAHSRGFYHRNIKPKNLLVDKQGVVKVIGLGLARVDFDLLEDDASFQADLTRQGSILGSADYLPPEQAVDSHKADHRSDIYALGCTMFVLLTGHLPYPVKSVMKKIAAHRDQPIPSLCERRAEVPASLELAFKRMVAKRPEDRYQSMDEVVAGLR
jgi:serine/threonine protein kinase